MIIRIIVNARIRSGRFLEHLMKQVLRSEDRVLTSNSPLVGELAARNGWPFVPFDRNVKYEGVLHIALEGDMKDSQMREFFSARFGPKYVERVVPAPMSVAAEMAANKLFALPVVPGRVNYVDFVSNGRKFRLLDQNPKTGSVFARALTKGWRIAWVIDPGVNGPGYTGDAVWTIPGDSQVCFGTKAMLKALVTGQEVMPF